MDMTSQIAFERAFAKANRLPQEERAIAPAGQVAYAHGVAEGEAQNRSEAFASDMAFRKEGATEKGREFELSGAERERQVTDDLEQRYTQTVADLDERERQFAGRLAWTGERADKTLGESERQFAGRLTWTGERSVKSLGESERQFGGRLTSSGSQFDRRLASEKEIFNERLGESSYESGMRLGQQATEFEQQLAFKATSFDDEMAWTREKFGKTMSFNDLVFADKMTRERRELDTWIQNNRIGAVIQLANTAVSAYGMYKGIDERKAMNAELKTARLEGRDAIALQDYKGTIAYLNQQARGAFDAQKFQYDPKYVDKGNYYLSEPVEQGLSAVSYPIPLSELANRLRPEWNANRMQIGNDFYAQ